MIDNAEMIKYLYHRLNNIEKKIIGLIKMINGRGEGGGEEGDIEKILSELKLEIGDLNLLKTVNKASVIEAINEVFDKEEAMAIIKVLDTLDSASTTSALSANKGRELKQLLDNKANIGDIPEVPTLDINANTRARHTHDNKNILDKISQSKIDEWDNKGSYEKPVNGIPENDLSADIKAALAKARSALQSYNENDPTVPEYVKGLTREDLERWNNKSDFSGDYNDLSNKPSLPDLQNVAYKDEIPKNISELNNDLGYISTSYHDSTKQDKILDLNTIREGAALGKTALQSFTEADPIYSADKPNLALKSEIPTNNNQLTNGAGYQTAADVEAAIAEIIHFSVKVVDRLPDVGEDKILYLVPKQSTVTDDVYNEYVWITTLNKYEFVGTTAVNLDDYYNKSQVDSLLNGKQNTITDLDIIREGAGKGMTAIQEHQDISGKADVGSPFNDMGETEDRETLFERVFDTEGNLFSGVDTETGNTIFIQKVIEKDGIMQGFFISSEDPEYIYKFTYSKNPYSFDISPVTFDIADNLTTNVDTMALAASQGVVLKSLIDGKGTYSKPSTGIPESDLSNEVKTKLNKDESIPLVPITYNELVTLRNNGSLINGMQYRITNYNTSSTDVESRVMNHQFDIIVVADSPSSLNENARAIQHDGDTYFTSSNLAAWELKYSLDNNASKYGWADIHGTGVIYYMKDEWENECPYDFKNIQFKRYKVATVTNAILNEYVGKYIGIKTGYGYTIDSTDFKWFYTFSDWSAEDAIADASIIGDKCGMNRFDKYRFGNVTQILNNNTIVRGSYVQSLCPSAWTAMTDLEIANNEFSAMSYNNSLFGYYNTNSGKDGFVRNNTLLGGMRHNILDSDFQTNAICGDEFCWNNITTYCGNNIIGRRFVANSVGGVDYKNNIVGTLCERNRFFSVYGNTIGSECQNNDFQYVHDNAIGSACKENKFNRVHDCTIGNTCGSNTCVAFYSNIVGTQFLGNQCNIVTSNTFGDTVQYCELSRFYSGKIGTGSAYVRSFGQSNNNEIGDWAFNVQLEHITSYVVTPNATSSKRFGGMRISRLRGTATAKIQLDAPQFVYPSLTGMTRDIHIEGSTDGKIVATWKEGFTTKGIYKDSATDTTWKELGATINIENWED